MSFIPAAKYLIGLAVFGIGYWLLNGIKEPIENVSASGNVFNLISYLWAGIALIYIIGGIIWVLRSYSEQNNSYFKGM